MTDEARPDVSMGGAIGTAGQFNSACFGHLEPHTLFVVPDDTGRRPAKADPGPISQLVVCGKMGPGSRSRGLSPAVRLAGMTF
jgi:hypothetical protein